jgi:putative glutamine amidotransferase
MVVDAPLIAVSTGFTDYGDYLAVAFSRPLEAVGAVPVALPYLRRPAALCARLDGVLLAVGRDLEPERFGERRHASSTLHSPLRDMFELALAAEAIAAGIPLLGICRGMQVINVALGGTLHLDHSVLTGAAARHPGGDWERWRQVVRARLDGIPPPAHPEHEIEIAAGSLLSQALGPRAVVNSYHHQSLATLGDGVRVSARAPDGVIEAIEVPSARAMCLAVQWELQEQPDSPLFGLLVDAARQHARDSHGGRPGHKPQHEISLLASKSFSEGSTRHEP